MANEILNPTTVSAQKYAGLNLPAVSNVTSAAASSTSVESGLQILEQATQGQTSSIAVVEAFEKALSTSNGAAVTSALKMLLKNFTPDNQAAFEDLLKKFTAQQAQAKDGLQTLAQNAGIANQNGEVQQMYNGPILGGFIEDIKTFFKGIVKAMNTMLDEFGKAQS